MKFLTLLLVIFPLAIAQVAELVSEEEVRDLVRSMSMYQRTHGSNGVAVTYSLLLLTRTIC